MYISEARKDAVDYVYDRLNAIKDDMYLLMAEKVWVNHTLASIDNYLLNGGFSGIGGYEVEKASALYLMVENRRDCALYYARLNAPRYRMG